MLTEKKMQQRESLAKAIDLLQPNKTRIKTKFLSKDITKAVKLIDSVLTDLEKRS